MKPLDPLRVLKSLQNNGTVCVNCGGVDIQFYTPENPPSTDEDIPNEVMTCRECEISWKVGLLHSRFIGAFDPQGRALPTKVGSPEVVLPRNYRPEPNLVPLIRSLLAGIAEISPLQYARRSEYIEKALTSLETAIREERAVTESLTRLYKEIEGRSTT